MKKIYCIFRSIRKNCLCCRKIRVTYSTIMLHCYKHIFVNSMTFPLSHIKTMDVSLNGLSISAKIELQSLCCMMGKMMSPQYHILAANGWWLASILWRERTSLFCRGIICLTQDLTRLIRRILKVFNYSF